MPDFDSDSDDSRWLQKFLEEEEEEEQMSKNICAVAAPELPKLCRCPHFQKQLKWENHVNGLDAEGPNEFHKVCGMHCTLLVRLCSLIDPLAFWIWSHEH